MILPDHRKQSRRRFPELAVFVCSLLLLCAASAPAQGFKLVQGYLEPVIARANRPSTITVMIQNTNALAAYDLRVQLSLPVSAVGLGASAGLTSNIPILAGGEIQSVTWDVQSSLATNTTATVRVIRGVTTNLTATFPVWWQSPLTVTHADYIPAPSPVGTGRYLVGSMVCPFWRDTGHGSIYNYPDRKPALGYNDEGDFEATDWQVKWALEHGVSFFATCWYRNPNNVGNSPVVPEHHRWLEGGFLNGRYGSQAKFAIMSVGDDIVSSAGDLVTNLFPYWQENYFKRTNYLVVDNKPVVFFFSAPANLTTSALSNAFVQARASAVSAGFSGLYIIGCNNGFFGGSTTNNQWMKDAGMDYSYAYHLPTFMGTFSSSTPSQSEAVADHQQVWDNQQLGVVPNLVTVSSGWNSEPWGNSVSASKWRLNPLNYSNLLVNARTELNSRTNASSGLETKVLLLDNWDEWGEGHFIGVTREYAWGYLDAVRSVFGTNSAHTDLSPPDVGRGTPYYDGVDRSKHVLASVGCLVVSNSGTATFQVKLSAAPTNTVIVTNTISLDQTNAVISGGASLAFTPANWNTPQIVTVSGLAATTRKLYGFSSAGGNSGYADDWVQIIVYPSPTNAPSTGSWTANGDGNWSSAANWQSAAIPSGDDATANFANAITGSRTVTVDSSPATIRNLVFSPSGSYTWMLTGGSIHLAGDAGIAVNANTATINSRLTGMSRLTKTGAGTLILNGTNSYAGGTALQGGFLRAGNTNALGVGAVSISSSATLDAYGKSLPVDVIVSGAGADGNGAVVNTSGANADIQNLSLLGNTTLRSIYGSLNIWGAIAGGGHTLTVRGNGTAGSVSIGHGQSDLGDINVESGALYLNGWLPNLRDSLGRPTNALTLSASGSLGLYHNRSDVTHTKRIVANGGTIKQWDLVSGTMVLDGEMTLNSSLTFDVAQALVVGSSIGGTGNLVKTSAGTLVLSGANSFTGNTILDSGTLQLGAKGSIAYSPLIAISNSGTLNVAAVAGGFALAPSQTLGGNGTVTGDLTTFGTLAPGTAIGRLTNNGAAILRGLTIMEIASAGGFWTNDQFMVTGALNCGGTLVVTNLSGNAMQLGDTFKLFQAASYNGTFTNLALPALGAGLSWTNRLATNGTLAVIRAVSTAPVTLLFTANATRLQLSWPADHIGWRLEAQTNSLAVGFNTNWVTVPGSWSTNSISLPMDASKGSVFLRLAFP
jgi:autotransporter-associated beta strand protein